MKNIRLLKLTLLCSTALAVSSCSAYYKEQILPPTEQEMENYREMRPTGAMKEGVFHMQRVDDKSTVLVQDEITLKRPDLPPFDVAYISRDVETVLLELANAAGESIVLPQGIKNRSITVVHSGANFQEMLDIVLSKIGYHYNYVNGVWYITRYPTKTYLVEIGQSERKGSLVSSSELSPEMAENGTLSASGSQLDTDYNDTFWEQIESTIKELIQVGKLEPAKSRVVSSAGFTSAGKVLSSASADKTTPQRISPIVSNDHMQPEEDAEPWYKITRSAGLITLRAAPEAHRLIENYLEQVQEASLKQVFIEMRIIAVTRDHATRRGANFSVDTDLGDTVLGSIGFKSSTPITELAAEGGFLSAFSQKSNGAKDLSTVIEAISKLGTVHTISSPSMLARNNQLSRISVTRQLGYAETIVDQNTTSTGSVVIGTRTDKPLFKNAGTVLSVFPYIGKQNVQLRLRLSVASKVGDTEIKTTVGTEETITNLVPELSNNVIDQDMVLEYGRVYAIGSLIETSTNFDNDYIPGLSELPGMSEVFRRAASRKQDTEFIVLLRVARG